MDGDQKLMLDPQELLHFDGLESPRVGTGNGTRFLGST